MGSEMCIRDRRIKEQPLKIMFPSLNDLDNIQLVCYSDASLANLPSGRSSEGYVIFAATTSNCCPILWKSNAIKRVVRSTLAAETSAMVDALDASYFVSAVLSEVLTGHPVCNQIDIPIVAFTDNESLHRNAYSTTLVDEYRLRIDLGVVKEHIEKGNITKLNWVPKSEQLANNCLTKHGANSLRLTCVFENGCFP